MVKNGHHEIPEVRYTPPTSGIAGIEVLTIAELRRRMERHDPRRAAQRPDFHLLLAVTEGLLWHMVDFQDYAVTDSRWVWVRPTQVQRFGDLTGATGAIVLFQPGTLDPHTASDVGLDNPFARTLWTLTGEDHDAMHRALDHLTWEFESTGIPTPVRATVLSNLLAVLLLRLTKGTTTVGTPPAEYADTFLHFRRAVEADFARHRDVAHYARRLGYSPRTLTRASLAATGFGAKDFIDRRVVLEAKRLLAHGDGSVAAVATTLGFPDASNFVKYFALRADATPAAFRQQLRFPSI